MSKKIDRTGETRLMKNGINATIIAYRNAHDLDVQFENGQVSYNKRYGNFKREQIACPVIVEYINDYIKITNPNPSKKLSFLIDIDDLLLAKSRLWVLDSCGYAGSDNGARLHRLIMNAQSGQYVDHINGNKLDDRKSNLRICTNAENMWNRNAQRNNTSGYKGVYRNKPTNNWKSIIIVNQKSIHLGYFDDITDAAKAYNEAAIKYHGEFASLNEIS